jgi:phosphoglycerate kinase
MKTVRDIQILENIPVLVRTSLNVPIKDGKVANAFRLKQALPTIEFLRKKHARVILIGHIGEAGTETLAPVYEAMKQFIPRLTFCPVSTGADARAAVRALLPGDVLMLENLRRDKGEVMNSDVFAKELAMLGDVFVEDSFDVCHREHASVVGIPKFLPSYAGLLVEKEVEELSKALVPQQPSIAILGGAKFSTKEPVLTKLLATYSSVFVGGALANDFMKASGHPVGKSLVSSADENAINPLLKDKRLILPVDYLVAHPGEMRGKAHSAGVRDVLPDEMILDEGPQTIAMLAPFIQNAKTILWNGPLGNYENGFTDGTEALARLIARSAADSILGGGDTVTVVEKIGESDRFTFISTGGGAMLDFLAKGTLPGIKVLG